MQEELTWVFVRLPADSPVLLPVVRPQPVVEFLEIVEQRPSVHVGLTSDGVQSPSPGLGPTQLQHVPAPKHP